MGSPLKIVVRLYFRLKDEVLGGIFMGRREALYFSMADYLLREIWRRLSAKLRNKFVIDKVRQAANSILYFHAQ
jgi:hypothetical protein